MNKRKLISAGLLPAMLLSACTGRAPSERPAPQVGVRTLSLVAPPDPTDTPYYNYFEKKSDSNEWLNNQLQTTRTIQIAAKELVTRISKPSFFGGTPGASQYSISAGAPGRGSRSSHMVRSFSIQNSAPCNPTRLCAMNGLRPESARIAPS